MTSDDESGREQRSILIVNESFQWRWILKPVFVLLFGLAITCVVVVFSMDYTIGASYREYIETLESTREILWPTVLTSGIIVFLVGTALVIWQFTRLTHKIAGPIYRIKQSLQELKAGNLSLRIQFREGDEFQELVDYFNGATETLDRRVGRIEKHLRSLEQQGELNDSQRRELDSIRNILDEFELSDDET